MVYVPTLPIIMLAFLHSQVRLRDFIILGPAMIAGFILPNLAVIGRVIFPGARTE